MSFINTASTLSLENNPTLAGFYPPERIHSIYNLSRQLVATNTLDVLLNHIVRQTVEILRARFTRIATMEADGNFVYQASYSVNDNRQASLCGQRVQARAKALFKHVALSEAPVMIWRGSNLSNDLRQSLRMCACEALFLFPLRVEKETVGVLAVGEEDYAVPETVLKEKIRLAVLIADQAASAVYRARLTNRLEESQLQTVMALAKVMESHDAYVSGHSHKVTELAVRLAVHLDCAPAEVQYIRWAAMLHDIGKVAIRDDVLNKTGPLSTAEWEEIRRHPESGAEIVRMASNLNYVAAIIQSHHERFDGAGYPHGLQGEMIPLGARILAVADAYSAMTDDRPYRKTFTSREALAELRRCEGSQFDPRVVDAFFALFP
jgi:putative nucleotidyltransferase with HDIG domain